MRAGPMYGLAILVLMAMAPGMAPGEEQQIPRRNA